MLRAVLLVSMFGVALVGLAACGGQAPAPDARTAAYRADQDACGTSVPEAVDKRNAKTGLAWFTSPVRRWGQIDDGVSACMADKGWGRTRTCTAEELRAGSQSRNLQVTSAGIRCTDPATRG